MLVRSTVALALIAAVAAPALLPTPAAAEERLVTIERFVPHTSTVPANEGRRVGLYLREKASAEAMARFEAGAAPEGRVVLFVHGGSVPSVPDYDLDYEDYSWMGHLAEAGFDTFAMDHTGYGRSPRPKMDDACNMSESDQAIVTPHPLSAPCEPSYPFGSTTVQSDWDEMDTVVDYIRELRGVERVSLVGWSAGGTRTGGYAARHPEKVDKLFLFAPGYRPDGPSAAPGELPAPGVPMRLQTRDTLMHGRWEDNVACADQVDPGIRAAIWRSILSFDPLGSVWGPPEGVMRVRAGNPSWGWNREYAAKVSVPTMIVVGAQDNPDARGVLHADLTGTDSRVLVTMECATHFANWERAQYRFMHRASLEWLSDGTFRGHRNGVYRVGVDGAEPTGE